MALVSATDIVVRKDRIRFTVSLTPDCPRTSWPGLVDELLRLHPKLPLHTCVNGKGPQFSAAMESTALIHVLEHLTIDCLVQDSPDQSALFVGASQWLSKSAGTGVVEVSFRDDIQALRAFKTALTHLNDALETRTS